MTKEKLRIPALASQPVYTAVTYRGMMRPSSKDTAAQCCDPCNGSYDLAGRLRHAARLANKHEIVAGNNLNVVSMQSEGSREK